MPLPIGAIAQAGVGLAQTIGGWVQQRKATKALEKLQSPTYRPNQSILDYYNQALRRYNVSPTDSAMYKRNMRDIDRNTASGVYALQGTGNTLGGVSSIIRAANDAKLNAEVAAESEKSQRFGQLGAATGMKADEDKTAFQINQYSPFERKYNLLAAKAAGGNQVGNAGISNIFGGLQNWNNMEMLKEMNKNGGGGFYNTSFGRRYR
jgi:hypothetical protein